MPALCSFASSTTREDWVVADPVTGKRKRKQASIPLGEIGTLKKWEAREKLKALIAEQLGLIQTGERPDPKTTFAWFVQHRYLPMREGRWHQATKDKTTYEINRYLVEYFKDRSLEEVTPFELQVHLNKLAKDFSDSMFDVAVQKDLANARNS